MILSYAMYVAKSEAKRESSGAAAAKADDDYQDDFEQSEDDSDNEDDGKWLYYIKLHFTWQTFSSSSYGSRHCTRCTRWPH